MHRNSVCTYVIVYACYFQRKITSNTQIATQLGVLGKRAAERAEHLKNKVKPKTTPTQSVSSSVNSGFDLLYVGDGSDIGMLIATPHNL